MLKLTSSEGEGHFPDPGDQPDSLFLVYLGGPKGERGEYGDIGPPGT